jgi:hypothetical protein
MRHDSLYLTDIVEAADHLAAAESADAERASVGLLPPGKQPHRAFQRYIGIDYSGAQTPASSLMSLRHHPKCGRRQVPANTGPVAKLRSGRGNFSKSIGYHSTGLRS